MKNYFTLLIGVVLTLTAPTIGKAQCALPATITPTTNPGEVEIEYDFSGVPNPGDYTGYVHFHNITTGIDQIWSDAVYDWNNPLLFTLPANGDYYAVAHSNDNSINCWDSLILGTFTISNLPNDCGASFYYVGITPNELSFTAAVSTWSGAINPTYSWDFGDGSTATGNPVNHTFPSTTSASYIVTLTVTDSACTGTSVSTVYIGITDCNASFFHNPLSIQTHEFTASTGFGGMSSNPTYFWDFGDGTNATGNPVTHNYTNISPQVFTVTLTVTDSLCISTFTSDIYAGAIPPSCGATMTITPDAPLSAGNTFTASGSFTTSTSIIWYFGDGNTSTSNPAYHVYNTVDGQNSFDVILVVTDSACVDSLFYNVSLGPNPQCQALFTLVQDTTSAGLYNGFNLSSTNGYTNYHWEFGDGAASNDQYPTHTYTTVGTYNVCLTITTDNNCSDSMCLSINVVVKSGTTINILDPNNTATVTEQEFISSAVIYPNPSAGSFTIQLQSNTEEQSLIQLSDITGRIVYANYHTLTKGSNILQINLNLNASGLYFLTCNNFLLGKVIVE